MGWKRVGKRWAYNSFVQDNCICRVESTWKDVSELGIFLECVFTKTSIVETYTVSVFEEGSFPLYAGQGRHRKQSCAKRWIQKYWPSYFIETSSGENNIAEPLPVRRFCRASWILFLSRRSLVHFYLYNIYVIFIISIFYIISMYGFPE